MDRSDIGDEGREFLAALARGDERAEQLQRIHEISVESAQGLLERSMDHYRYCREADFWKAAETLEIIVTAASKMLAAHKALLTEERLPDE